MILPILFEECIYHRKAKRGEERNSRVNNEQNVNAVNVQRILYLISSWTFCVHKAVCT